MRSAIQVSVCMITYGHEDFIQQAIEGVLMQECDFNVELIIANDCSPDTTDEIVQTIIETHPRGSWIKYIRNEKNIGMMPNFVFALQQCQGKYIALCDGDDYWTDCYKLKKQVEFMEMNQDYGICFHNVEQQNTLNEFRTSIIPGFSDNTVLSIYDYILENKTATCSMLFRIKFFKSIPKWFDKLPYGDLGLVLNVLKNSNQKAMVLTNIMSVYRVHAGGIHSKFLKNKKTLIKTSIQHLDFTTKMGKYLLFNNEYKEVLYKKKEMTLHHLLSFYKNDSVFKYLKYRITLFVLKLKSQF